VFVHVPALTSEESTPASQHCCSQPAALPQQATRYLVRTRLVECRSVQFGDWVEARVNEAGMHCSSPAGCPARSRHAPYGHAWAQGPLDPNRCHCAQLNLLPIARRSSLYKTVCQKMLKISLHQHAQGNHEEGRDDRRVASPARSHLDICYQSTLCELKPLTVQNITVGDQWR
jgi:hypothetical protein